MRISLLSRVSSLVLLLAGAAPVLAHPNPSPRPLPAVSATPQEPPQQSDQPLRVEENIVVTADREADDIRNVGSSVSVITAEEIAASGARWLTEVLPFVPGVTVVRSGPAGSVTQVFLRGANTSHTLFLIDGVKVNSPATGSYDTSGLQLAADQIERIEVVRGPQSALYGSQAVGGVINVITRRGTGAGTWGVEGDGGSYGTGRVHTWASGQAGNTQLIGGVSYFDSRGFSAADSRNGNVETDGAHDLSYNGRVDYRSHGGWLLRGAVRGFDAGVDFDGYDFVDGPVDALRNVQTTREVVAAGTAGWRGARFSSQIEASLTADDLQSLTPDDFFDAFELDSSIAEVDWQSEVAMGQQTLVSGLEYRREAARSTSHSAFGETSYDQAVDVIGVYAQDRVRLLDRATVTAGVRYENHSTFGGQWTGRVTGTVDLDEAWRVHTSVGSAFKAPTLNDLYYPGFGNPDLQPEESVGFDVGIEMFLVAPRLRVDITAFHNAVHDLIEFDFVSNRPENIGDATTAGIEIGGEWMVHSTVEITGSYSFTTATPEDAEQQLVRRPRNGGSGRVTWRPTPQVRLWGELRFQDESFDNGAGGRVALDGFAVVNLAGNYRLGRVVLRGRIDNLFDAAYQQVAGYGTAGISGYFGATLALSR